VLARKITCFPQFFPLKRVIFARSDSTKTTALQQIVAHYAFSDAMIVSAQACAKEI
jgi:hypothetical protein